MMATQGYHQNHNHNTHCPLPCTVSTPDSPKM